MEITKEAALAAAGLPSPEQLAAINRMSKSPLAAEQVYVFSLRLCDDQPDRDLERFDKAALEPLAEMFVGKTGILSGGPARILRGTELAATAAKWEASTVREVKPVYGFGDGQPAGLSAGDTRYVLTLEELVPEAGQPDPAALSNFQVEICRAGRMVTYTGCVWKRFRQTRTASGSRLTAEAEAAGYTEV